jgi:glycosyltransferase involved in cell wall biosynthesis
MTKKFAFLLPDMRGGGAERVALSLVQDFVRRGCEVDLLLMKAEGELLALLPGEVRVIDLQVARIRNLLFPLIRYLRDEKPDAIQILMWPLTVIAILAHLISRSKARLVVADHSTLSRDHEHRGVASKWALKSSIRLLYPKAHSRIIVSSAAADDLSAMTGISRESIDVIYNPVASLPAEAGSLGEEIWGAGTARILTVGNLNEVKNHALLIRAFAQLVRKRPAKLIILGEGLLRARLEQMIADQNLSGQISLPGFTLDPWPYYRSADLFVLSSNYEGFGNVLVEAMRAGLRIVSTDCESGPREILDRGRYGTLVPCRDEQAMADAMEEALHAPADAEAAAERAEQLSGKVSLQRYFDLMVGTGSAARPANGSL